LLVSGIVAIVIAGVFVSVFMFPLAFSIKEDKNESVDIHYLQNIKERCNHTGATYKENYDGRNYACIFTDPLTQR